MESSPPVLASILIAVLAAIPCTAPAAEDAKRVGIAEELARLATTHSFAISGEEHLVGSIGRAEGDDPVRRVRILLEDFDHIIVQDGRGGIDRVIVMGAAEPGAAPQQPVVAVDGGPPPDAPIELPTVRDGSQHSVRVALEGTNGRRLARLMLIDTGADTVVLPASLITQLGIDAGELEEREVQTANGLAQAQTGKLAAVWLGPQRVADVTVAFLEDEKLGKAGLLGMSVLGRYQMTIDDQENRLTLTGR